MSEQKDNIEFIVTARKWRPQLFSSVVGQEHITNTLQNALKNNRLHHAYLFCGPRGVGKTTTARILARAVNCLNPIDHEPCNECASCEAVLTGRSLDIIEIDGASNNSVDDIRKLRENARYAPSTGKYKMYIIDEVHMLSTSAFNALLKTLEEPPPHLLFVFATTESHKVPATIISRCQRFDFRRMELESIISQLSFIAEKENISIDRESLVTIAKKADGSMRDSQSIFDQVIAFCGNNVVYTEMAAALHLIDEDFFFRISDAIASRNIAEAFLIAEDVIEKGYELGETLQGLLEHFRNILTVKAMGNTSLIETSESFKEKYQETADKFSKADLLRYIQIIANTEAALKFAPQPRIRFELALAQMASMDKALEVSELISEIRALKNSNFNVERAATAETASNAAPVQITNHGQSVSNENKSAISQVKPIQPATAAQSQPMPPSIKPAPAPHTHAARSSSLLAEEISARWASCMHNLVKADPSLKVISQATVKFFNSEIVFETNNSFIESSLKNKTQFISNFVHEHYKANIKIVVVLSESASATIQEPNNSNNYTADNSSQDEQPVKIDATMEERLKDKTPTEVKIITYFNAYEAQ